MEVYQFVLYCMLFTTVASFNLPDVTPENTDGSLFLDSQSKTCECENGKCVTDNLGNSKCICKPGYALQDEFTCKPCDCGSVGKCIFVLKPTHGDKYQYEKKCVCDVGHAEKDGVCVDCFCGDNSACDFDQGERRCYCIEGYSEKAGVCTKCDCGFFGQCEYEGDNKVCTCDEGYLELNGKCEECNCGGHGTCSFKNGQKTCKCEPGYSVKDGICEPCDCGSNSESCVFVSGVKQCNCKNRYADRYGTCEECYCGDYTRNCSFTDNQKTCDCLEDYVQKGETCELGCSTKNLCQNGGFCKAGFCFCQKGTRGEFCEVIDECVNNLCPVQGDIQCSYDVASQKAYCRCLDSNLRYNPDAKQCRNTCDDGRPCQNGGSCGSTGPDLFCKCPPGTTGDLCEKIPECDTKQCSLDSKCVYDVTQGKAVCRCNDANLNFDPKTLQCKNSCDETRSCQNGGQCSSRGTDSFCDCLEGTTGDLCEKVPECESKNCGSDARCVYDQSTKKAACVCNDDNLSFDPSAVRCKNSCDKTRSCQNGGQCSSRGTDSFCDCLEGTTGDLCEKVPECESKNCGSDARCAYDLSTKKAACVCNNDSLSFDPFVVRCKNSCDDGTRSCYNDGTCSSRGTDSFCDCLEGTTGDLCENVPECDSKNCGSDASCAYDPKTKTAVCVCNDNHLSFDPADIRCKYSCDKTRSCYNGGQCSSRGTASFCDCLEGTTGDLCEKVPECDSKSCGWDAKCAYDSRVKQAVCQCNDAGLSFDPATERCKRTCVDDKSCKNQGKCKGTSQLKFCNCLNGTTGDFCEDISECDCGPDAKCVFNPSSKKASCACKNPSLHHDSSIRRCRRICSNNNECLNGGKCVVIGSKKFCRCLPGTQGDKCEIIKNCPDCRGEGAYCEYDVKKLNATCKCKDKKLEYDFYLRKCIWSCHEDKDCLNGGRCRYRGEHKFCTCLRGTQGPRCQVVDDCYAGRVRCRGTNAQCVFDVKKLKGYCRCVDRNDVYDHRIQRCRRTHIKHSTIYRGKSHISLAVYLK